MDVRELMSRSAPEREAVEAMTVQGQQRHFGGPSITSGQPPQNGPSRTNPARLKRADFVEKGSCCDAEGSMIQSV
jgi:hypothetical protein